MLPVNPKLSIVVIGRNEGSRLARCLASVAAMVPVEGGHETIYVDSASTDNSVSVAQSFGARTITLHPDRPTAAKARNAGWQSARGKWILFLDGDTILDPHFSRLALAAATPEVAVVWGHRREMFPNANLFHRVLDLDWVYAPGLTEFCGGDALIRREALEAVNGFDPTLIAGEEPEMCARLRELGYVIRHIDSEMTRHDLAITRWSQYWKRASRAGYAYAQMSWRTRNRAVQLWTSEAKANAIRAVAILGLLASAFVAPMLAFAMLTLLTLRSAYRSRWKSDDWFSLLCYGAHSHLQQLPIFAGQLAFWCDLAQDRQRGLIEYK
jgi:cellulose synthase/poly-beta-1,6-N-acetylglucosamine synthase-like glycosyltransferase